MNFKRSTLLQIADMICGNFKEEKKNYFIYRSSSKITDFFYDSNADYVHDGSTRNIWVADTLTTILNLPQPNPLLPSDTFSLIIQELMAQSDAYNENTDRENALTVLNAALFREGLEAFYSPDKKCYLKHIGTQTVALSSLNPHRAFSDTELKKKEALISYLNYATEDELTAEILLPLFRQLGFLQITSAEHKDKALEYGKDIWMKFVLPTLHILYFGIQVKKGKLDSSGMSKGGNTNIAEILNQALMMIGHEIFDSEIGKKVLVDHAFIVAGGEITKAAKNWLAGKLDASKRSQIMFMDREYITNLFVVTNLPVPNRNK